MAPSARCRSLPGAEAPLGCAEGPGQSCPRTPPRAGLTPALSGAPEAAPGVPAHPPSAAFAGLFFFFSPSILYDYHFNFFFFLGDFSAKYGLCSQRSPTFLPRFPLSASIFFFFLGDKKANRALWRWRGAVCLPPPRPGQADLASRLSSFWRAARWRAGEAAPGPALGAISFY